MKKLVFVLAMAFLGTTYANSIKITSPKGGWRDSSTKKVKFSQEVNYPDVSVSMPENQPDSGRIEGQIRGDIKNNPKPLKMIVNGNAMPLKHSNGKFARPFSFGTGSNNVEIRTHDSKHKARMQFYDVKKGGTPSRIRVILSWDTDGTDLDLHVLNPSGERCSYMNRKLEDGSALDIDVTTGYGPEIFSSPGLKKGPYLIYVNYYGRSTQEIITTATVSIITDEGTADEKVVVKRVPLRHPGELTYISSFVHI